MMLNLLLSTTSSSSRYNCNKSNGSIISLNDCDDTNVNCHSTRFRRKQHQNKQSACSNISSNFNELSRYVCRSDNIHCALKKDEEEEEVEKVERMMSSSFSSQLNHYQPPMSRHSHSTMEQKYANQHQPIGLDGRQHIEVPLDKQQQQKGKGKRSRQFFTACLNLAHIRRKKNARKVFDTDQNSNSDSINSNNNSKKRIPDNGGFIDQLKTCLEAKIFLTKMYISRRFRTTRTRMSQHQQTVPTDNDSNLCTSSSNNNAGWPQIYTNSSSRSVAPMSSSSPSSASYSALGNKPFGPDHYSTNASSKLDGLILNLVDSSGPAPTNSNHDYSHPRPNSHQFGQHKQQDQLDGTIGVSSSMNAPSASSTQEREFPLRNSFYFASLFNGQQRKRAFNYKQRTLLMEKLNLLLVRMLSADGQMDMESARSIEEACAICFSAKVDVQTFPCKHCAVCFYCFIRTIYVALQDNQYPLKCVICRSKVERIKATFYGRAHDNKMTY